MLPSDQINYDPSADIWKDHVLHLNCLDEEAKEDAIALLNQVREAHEKPLQMPSGRRGKYLE